MKKSLIALAALATVATAAQAQSSVTIYGIVDSGYLSYKDDGAAGRIQGVASGALSTSRLGFRGTEDLGGGLKANFTLENQFSADTGAQSGDLFTRGAWVQLDQAGIGSITFGRQNNLDYVNVIAGDAFGAANIGGFVSVGYLASGIASSSTARSNNAVTLQSAKFAGFDVAYQHAFGEQAGSTNKLKSEAYRITYTYGQLNLSAASRERKDANGVKAERVSNYFANYDFGVAKAFLGYQENDLASGVTIKASSVGAVVPVNAKVNLMAAYHNVENTTGTNNGDAKAYSLGATYGFSKRTTAYAIYATSNVDATGTLRTENLSQTATQGKDNTTYALGIRHTF